jgi:hypothetical protein
MGVTGSFGRKNPLGTFSLNEVQLHHLIFPYPRFASQGYEARYLMIIYPLFAILLGIFFYGAEQRQGFFYWALGLVILKFLIVCLILPLYLHFYRGDYAKTAAMIIKDTAGKPFYNQDMTAVGESIVINIDLQRRPLPPVTMTPQGDHYWVLRDPKDPPPSNGHLVRIYPSENSHSRTALYEIRLLSN